MPAKASAKEKKVMSIINRPFINVFPLSSSEPPIRIWRIDLSYHRNDTIVLQTDVEVGEIVNETHDACEPWLGSF